MSEETVTAAPETKPEPGIKDPATSPDGPAGEADGLAAAAAAAAAAPAKRYKIKVDEEESEVNEAEIRGYQRATSSHNRFIEKGFGRLDRLINNQSSNPRNHHQSRDPHHQRPRQCQSTDCQHADHGFADRHEHLGLG